MNYLLSSVMFMSCILICTCVLLFIVSMFVLCAYVLVLMSCITFLYRSNKCYAIIDCVVYVCMYVFMYACMFIRSSRNVIKN